MGLFSLFRRKPLTDKDILGMVKTGDIEIEVPKGYQPVNGNYPIEVNREFRAMTFRGPRTAKLNTTQGLPRYIYTDCTHELQHCILNREDILYWRYLD